MSSVASVSGHAGDESVASITHSPAISEAVPSSVAASHAVSSPELSKAQTGERLIIIFIKCNVPTEMIASSASPEIKVKSLAVVRSL